MYSGTYSGTLGCVLLDTGVTFVLHVDPLTADILGTGKDIEIEIGDHLVIIDKRVPGAMNVIYNGIVKDINPTAFQRIPEGFSESIVLLLRKRIINFRVMLKKRKLTVVDSFFEKLFS